LNFGLFPWANLTRKAQHITKKETAQHDQHESSTDLTTGSDHYFLIFFLITYQLRKHTNSQVNLIKGVAYRKSTILARNLKHHLGSKLGALEVEFEPVPMGKTD
jgi:hypothetical protein